MRTRNSNLLIVCVLFLTCACLETEIIQEQEQDLSFNAVISAPECEDETKASIDKYNDYGSAVGVLWNPNEEIGVYNDYSQNVKFTSTNTRDDSNVTFRGLLFGTPKYAYYPYSAENNGVPISNIKGSIPQFQSFSDIFMKLHADYKVGILDQTKYLGSTFDFTRVVCIWKFVINATGSPLEGHTLNGLSVKVSNNRKITGDFTMNLKDQSISIGEFSKGCDSLYMSWGSYPIMDAGTEHVGYINCLPSVLKGDVYEIEIITDTHIAKLSRTSGAAHKSNGLYKFTLNLCDYNMEISERPPITGIPTSPSSPAVGTHPVLHSMKFTVADNPGKILGRKLKASNYKTISETRTEEVCTVDTTNHTISLYLPYLNNRKLVPVFEIPEGTQLFYEGGEIISGETEVDFATYKQVAVVNEVGDGVIYDINFTNTGLPVVVVNQQTGTVTSNSGDYRGGSTAWYNATGAAWQPKDSDWLMSDVSVDNFMVYNADGTSAVTDKNGATVNEPLLASTRVRGNVSQKMPKKPFAVKLDKKSGIFLNDSDQTNDLPAHKRWVLLANWSDRTLMRNAIAFGIADIFKQTFPTDGIGWNPSGQFVELVYNGVHVGNYYLCEQVKIDGNRLDISDPYDKDDAYSGNAEDYGYLLESDDAYDEDVKFITKTYIPFQFKDDADGGGDMLSYAKAIVNGIDDNLYNGKWADAFAKMDMSSFVDFLLIQELTMNGELSHPKSVYTYIDGGKLYAGPIWDFDWQTFPNISVIEAYYENAYTGGRNTYNYTYTTSMLADGTFNKSTSYPSSPKTNDKSYMWYPMLVKNADFKAMAAERWNAVKGAIGAYADMQIPAMAAKIKKSEAENWSMWPLESGSKAGQNRWSTYDVGGGFKGDEAMTFDNAVTTLTNNIITRINGMNYVSNKNWPSVKGVPSYSSSTSRGSSSGSTGSSSSNNNSWWGNESWPW